MKRFLILVLTLWQLVCQAAPTISEYEMKATYLYNFIALTTYPTQIEQEEFRVCLWGRDNFGTATRAIQGKKIRDIPVMVSRISSLSSARKCHLLYVAEPEALNLKAVYHELGNWPILIVTDTMAPSTAMINLYLDNQRVMFEVDNTKARSAGLQLSSKLLQYARPMLIQE